MQCRHLTLLYGDCPTTRRWRHILRAEVVDQRLYYQTHKRYLADQRAFVVGCLAKPEPGADHDR